MFYNENPSACWWTRFFLVMSQETVKKMVRGNVWCDCYLLFLLLLTTISSKQGVKNYATDVGTSALLIGHD